MTANDKIEFRQKNIQPYKKKSKIIKAELPTPKLRTEVCEEAAECDTCMSVLTTLLTMQMAAIPEYNCKTMIFSKGCNSVCENTKREFMHNNDLSPYKNNNQNSCSACFRIGHCHLKTCEDYDKTKQEEERRDQAKEMDMRKQEADVS